MATAHAGIAPAFSYGPAISYAAAPAVGIGYGALGHGSLGYGTLGAAVAAPTIIKAAPALVKAAPSVDYVVRVATSQLTVSLQVYNIVGFSFEKSPVLP